MPIKANPPVPPSVGESRNALIAMIKKQAAATRPIVSVLRVGLRVKLRAVLSIKGFDMERKKVLLAAGGTGGHLFPAFALTEELKRRGVEVHIVTDERIDQFSGQTVADGMHVVPSATIKSKSPLSLMKTGFTLFRGVLKARKLLKRLKPDFVLGFGGYPTFPPLLAAGQMGIATGLHDQNAVMGRANRLLAKRVDVIATSFAEVKYLPDQLAGKVRRTGNPVRAKVLAVKDTPYPPLEPDGLFHLLIFGGSQGARFFSEFFPAALAGLKPEVKARLRVTQQCRSEDLERVRGIYQRGGISARLETFFEDLPAVMAASHLIISRSGASTVTELAICGRPAIMVPLPHALDNDQLLNARSLADHGAGWVIEQKDLAPDAFLARFEGFYAQPQVLQNAANAAKSLAQPEAVVRLADVVMEFASHYCCALGAFGPAIWGLGSVYEVA